VPYPAPMVPTPVRMGPLGKMLAFGRAEGKIKKSGGPMKGGPGARRLPLGIEGSMAGARLPRQRRRTVDERSLMILDHGVEGSSPLRAHHVNQAIFEVSRKSCVGTALANRLPRRPDTTPLSLIRRIQFFPRPKAEDTQLSQDIIRLCRHSVSRSSIFKAGTMHWLINIGLVASLLLVLYTGAVIFFLTQLPDDPNF
jgi:hypothetical protein